MSRSDEEPGAITPHVRKGTLRGMGSELEKLGIVLPSASEASGEPAPASGAEPAGPEAGLSAGMIVAGKFALVKLVAEGGLAQVFEAEDTLVGRRVALKVLLPVHAKNADVVGRFRREAHATALVAHPNVVTIYEVGRRSDGSLYIVQELLEGPTLHEYRQTRGRLAEGEALRIVTPLAEALATAHAQGVVHRDVKSGNVVLARTHFSDMLPKLIDFGVARLQTQRGQARTTVRTLLGTAHYMSPEQALGEPWVDGRTDVWALGIVLYELLSGTYPFDGTNEHAILAKVVDDEVPRLEDRVPDVSAPVAALVHAALERDAERRPEMRALLAELTKLGPGARDGEGPLSLRQPARGEASFEAHAGERQARRLALELTEPEPSAPSDDDSEELSEGDYEELFADRHPDGRPSSDPGGVPDTDLEVASERTIPAPSEPPLAPPSDWIRGTAQVQSEFARAPAPAAPADIVQRYGDAALRALSLNALEDAVAHADTALACGTIEAEDAAQLHLVRAIAHLWLGAFGRAEASGRAAWKGMPPGSTGWYAAFGHVVLARARLGELESLPTLVAALGEAPGARLGAAHVIAVARLAIAMIRAGMLSEARQLVRSMRDRMDKDAHTEPVVYAWLDCAFAERAAFVGDPSRELSRRVSALERFTAAGDVRNACQERAGLGAVYLAIGELEEAERVLDESLCVAQPMRLHLAHGIRSHLALAALRSGDLDRALVSATTALEGLAGSSNRYAEAYGQVVLSRVQAARGVLDRALAAADRAVVVAAPFPELAAHARGARAAALLLSGRGVDALEEASRAFDLLSEHGGAGSGEGLIRLTHALALDRAGDSEGALRRALEARDRIIALGERLGDPRQKRSFWERVPENAQILALARSWSEEA